MNALCLLTFSLFVLSVAFFVLSVIFCIEKIDLNHINCIFLNTPYPPGAGGYPPGAGGYPPGAGG